jgi:hypothetical protein
LGGPDSEIAGFSGRVEHLVSGRDARFRWAHRPEEEMWLVKERRSTGERKFSLTNHPAHTPAPSISRTLKAWWSYEHGRQQL